MEEISVAIRLLNPGASVPNYASPGDGACDLTSTIDLVLPPGGRALVPTGIAVEIPAGYGGLVLPRSGLAINSGVTCLNAPGLIDSGYRGEVKVVLMNHDQKSSFHIAAGDRVAQFVVVKLPFISFRETDALTVSERGSGGFGHTGV